MKKITNSFKSARRKIFRLKPVKKAHGYAKVMQWYAGNSDILPFVLRQRRVKALAKRYGIARLIETGTYQGDMVNATRDTFKKIDSIELSKDLYEKAALRFKGDSHIKIWHGDSPDILPQLVSDSSQPILFWLDAHYSGGVTARSTKLGDTPIEEELAIIFSKWNPGSIIAIDDARCFDGTNNYPTLDRMREIIRAANLNLCSVIENDCILIKDAFR